MVTESHHQSNDTVMEQRLTPPLWIGGTKEFRENTLLDVGGFAAVRNVGYQSAIQKNNDALVFIPRFLKNRTKNNLMQ